MNLRGASPAMERYAAFVTNLRVLEEVLGMHMVEGFAKEWTWFISISGFFREKGVGESTDAMARVNPIFVYLIVSVMIVKGSPIFCLYVGFTHWMMNW